MRKLLQQSIKEVMKTWIKEVMTGITDYGKVLRKRRC